MISLLLSGDALQKLEKSKVDELIVSDSVPQEENLKKRLDPFFQMIEKNLRGD